MRKYPTLVPFPHRLIKKKLNDKFLKFLEIMKGVQAHIPLLQAMTQMPLYAKFFNKLISYKKILEEVSTNAPHRRY